MLRLHTLEHNLLENTTGPMYKRTELREQALTLATCISAQSTKRHNRL